MWSFVVVVVVGVFLFVCLFACLLVLSVFHLFLQVTPHLLISKSLPSQKSDISRDLERERI